MRRYALPFILVAAAWVAVDRAVAAEQAATAIAPAVVAAAQCQNCEAAAANVRRISDQLRQRRADLDTARAPIAGNDANIRNLQALRAAPDNSSERNSELDVRIAALRDANRSIRVNSRPIQEDILKLTGDLEAARRTLDECNRRCGTATGNPPPMTDPHWADVNAGTLSIAAACPECEAAADNLRREHRVLQQLAERANARHMEADFEAFEDQRARVAQLEADLIACNRKCARTSTGSGGDPIAVAALPALDVSSIIAPRAMCPECQAAADQVRTLMEQRLRRSNDRARELDRIRVNDANIANLQMLRGQTSGDRATELDRRIDELRDANREVKVSILPIDEDIQRIDEQIDSATRALDACNARCVTTAGAGTNRSIGTLTGAGGHRTVTVQAISARAACVECEIVAAELRLLLNGLQRLAQRANDLQIEEDFKEFEERRARAEQLQQQLDACNKKCTTTASTPCGVGDYCNTPDWDTCVETDTCAPVEKDCGIPGVCMEGWSSSGNEPLISLAGDSAWSSTVSLDIDIQFQEKLVDVPDPPAMLWRGFNERAGVPAFNPNNTSARTPWRGWVVPPSETKGVMQWFNPLGLLARRLVDHIDRWRGSMAPRPLIRASDLELIDRVTNVQAAGLPKGLHLLLMDQGGSTGKTLTMQVLNLTGAPVRLSSKSFAVQPIKQQAQQKAMQAFSRLSKASPMQLDLSAYCVEFLKLPPGPNTLLRLAPANVQQKYAPMARVLQSAHRVTKANALHPDSTPAAYTDSIKQWAVWAVEQKFNQQSFTDAFIGHTKKNVEGAGQKWSKDAEAVIRKVSPNRWQDISKILRGAGLRVPQ